MKVRSQRGAARVSAVWMIVVVVLFFVSLAFAYVSNQEAQRAKEARATADTSAQAADAKWRESLTEIRSISESLGYYDRDVPGATSDVPTSKDGLAGLRAALALPESVTDFERSIQPVIDAYRAKEAEIATLTGRVSSLEGQLQAARAANTKLGGDLQALIDKGAQDLRDAEQNAQDEKDRLERDIADLRNQINQLGSELNDQKGLLDDTVAQADRDAAAASTRMSSLNRQLQIMKETPGADGEILAVSEELGLGWINRGAKDRVSRGMRFEVRSGHPNPALVGSKAMAEVTDVGEQRSEVRFLSLADPLDPVVPRDKIFNPIFDPEGGRYAVLLGRFSGAFNEAELRLLLEDIGITVQDKLDLTTNYLIVGGPLFYDEEGEPVEEPIQPSELPTYKDAQELGTFIVSVNDLRQYFQR